VGATIVLTDHAWPDVAIERAIAEDAGHKLVPAQLKPGDVAGVEALIAAHNPTAIMTCWAQVSARAIELPTTLKIVARMGVGLDNIAIAAATARGAWVSNVPDYCVEEVSDHVVALLLNRWRGVGHFDQEVKAGRWQPSTAQLYRVSTRTVGIIGYGKIGRMTARKLSQGFGCKVLAHSRSLLADPALRANFPANVAAASIEQIQYEADAIVLHLPLTTATRQLVNGDFMRACRRQPLLVNVSRGGLVDNAALLQALQAGVISAAALDVVDGEPTPPPELVNRSDVAVTPHIAFSSDASLRELRERSTHDVLRALRGERPLHPCNQL
jgi:D-3-phosphoglycerate dehydrogenase / 2-oxoglutarate reductase